MQAYLSESIFFGVFLTIVVFQMGVWMQKKFKLPIFNPLLISMIVIILLLTALDIPYESYRNGAKYIGDFLTPLTVCLAIPLYRQIRILKENLPAIFVSIGCGCLAHIATIMGLSKLLGLEDILRNSLMGKSVTTPIALGVTAELGGIQGITIVGVCAAGILGAVIGPGVLKLVRVKEPIAVGLGLGAGSHAIGTSKAMELGQLQGAMSSLAIVVTGILTVVLVPIFLS